MKRSATIATFVIFLGLWTWKLLEPHPLPESLARGIPEDASFWLAKTLHAGAYAFLTVLAACIPTSRSYFLSLVLMLFLHGVGTEIGQLYVPNRHGCVRDVIIDWTGVSAGLAFLWGLGWSWCGKRLALAEKANINARTEAVQGDAFLDRI